MSGIGEVRPRDDTGFGDGTLGEKPSPEGSSGSSSEVSPARPAKKPRGVDESPGAASLLPPPTPGAAGPAAAAPLPVKEQFEVVVDEHDEDDDVAPSEGKGLYELLTETPTSLAKRVFSEDILNTWKQSGSGVRSNGEKRLLKIRSIWELAKPKSQCLNTIGPVTKDTKCWICGNQIPLKPKKEEFGLIAQCEHVLPIAQAVLLLGLYSPVDKNDPKRTEYLQKEYGWAHATCNQTKSDRVLFKIHETEENRFDIDNYAVESLLHDIFKTNRKDGVVLRKQLEHTYGKKISQFIAARSKEMTLKMQTLLDHINGRLKEGGPGLHILTATINSQENIAGELKAIRDEISQRVTNGILVDEIYIDDYEDNAINLLLAAAEGAAATSSSQTSVAVSEVLDFYDWGATASQRARASASASASLTNSPSRAGSARHKRRTRRRTDRVFPKRHHSMRISSIRHSLSGKAASR